MIAFSLTSIQHLETKRKREVKDARAGGGRCVYLSVISVIGPAAGTGTDKGQKDGSA